MVNHLGRIITLEHRARAMPRPAGTPDYDRLTPFEQARLRELSIKADVGGGLHALTNDEVEVGADLMCRLWNRHPDRAHETYPWPDAEHAGPVL